MQLTQEQWKQLCEQFSKSQQTKAEFCRQNNINIYKFYSYLNKFYPHLIDHSKGRKKTKVRNKKITSFIPVKYEAPKEKLFKIELHSGLKISFELLPEQLPQFIKTLESSNESNL